LSDQEQSDINDAIIWSAKYLEEEHKAEGINMHSFDGNSCAGEYYVHMIPRLTGDFEKNDQIYGLIDSYDRTILEKFK